MLQLDQAAYVTGAIFRVSDFMVNSRQKTLKEISVECMECLNEDVRKKKLDPIY